MKLAFSLRENIQCETICAKIQNLINNNINSIDPHRTLLVVDLVTITKDDNGSIPNIEYHSE